MYISFISLLITASFFGSVEFYVVCVVVAAAVVAAAVKPSDRSPVITHLLSSELSPDDDADSGEYVTLLVRDDGSVVLTRHGVSSVGLDGAVSAAVSVKGFDITVDERLVPGRTAQDQPVQARFVLDFLGAERYHLRYNSDLSGRMAVGTLTVMPGVELRLPLRQ